MDKQQRVDAIVASLKEQAADEEQIAEVQAAISQAERAQLDATSRSAKK